MIYKTLEIVQEDGERFFTILNKSVKIKTKFAHAHANSLDEAKRIVDCYLDFKTVGISYEESNYVKTAAMRLLGLKFFDYRTPSYKERYTKEKRTRRR